MDAAERRQEIVTRVMLTAAKVRGTAAELGTLDVAKMLDPTLYGDGPLSLVVMADRMLEGGRTPEPIDVYNLLFMAGRSPGFDSVYAIRWDEELPEPMEAMA